MIVHHCLIKVNHTQCFILQTQSIDYVVGTFRVLLFQDEQIAIPQLEK